MADSDYERLELLHLPHPSEQPYIMLPLGDAAALRDHFAGLAMQSFLATGDNETVSGTPEELARKRKEYRNSLCVEAYLYAGAMLAARSSQEEPAKAKSLASDALKIHSLRNRLANLIDAIEPILQSGEVGAMTGRTAHRSIEAAKDTLRVTNPFDKMEPQPTPKDGPA